MVRYTGLLGLLCFIAIAYAWSSNRKAIHWKTVGWAMALQWLLALVVLKGKAIAGGLSFVPWPAHLGWGVLALAASPMATRRVQVMQQKWIKWSVSGVVIFLLLRGNLVGAMFDKARTVVGGLMSYASAGASFVFGQLANADGPQLTGASGAPVGSMPMVFAFVVLPTIIFVASIFAVLYYLGAMQWIVGACSRAISRFLRVSGAESLCVSASILMGQTEAPLTIRPYLAKLTRSELMVIMTAGMAHVSGSIMVAYVAVAHVDVVHLLTAVIMTAPGAIMIAKILEPETDVPETSGEIKVEIPCTDANVLDAAARGASEGLHLAINVAGMLIAFIALIALLNGIIHAGFPNWSLERILGLVFRPFAFLMGIPWKESGDVGSLLGQRMVVNEFVAFIKLGSLPALSDKARLITTFALCGFANFSSIAIQVGGIGALVPERRGDLARLGLKAMVAGTLANFMSACIAGILC